MFERIREALGLTNVSLRDLRKETKRVSWNHIFLIEAHLWSKRSHDPQTQCGCVLVSPDHTVLSTGYNGFIRDIDDKALPNLRPATQDQLISKYDFMIHAEHNAILNCARQGRSTVASTAYITGPPCNWCLQYMWQAGITKIVYSDFQIPQMMKNDTHKRVKQALLELMNPRQCIHLFDDYSVGQERMSMCFIPSSEINLQELLDK